MRSLVTMVPAALSLVFLAVPARADYVFDSISNFVPLPYQLIISGPEHADETRLDATHGLAIDSVELLCRLRSMSDLTDFSGTLTMRLRSRFVGSQVLPGPAFYEATEHVDIARGTDQLVAFAVPHVTAPSADIWTSWFFTRDNGSVADYGDVWVRQTNLPALVGMYGPTAESTSDLTATFSNWSPENVHYAIRIGTVPGPGSGSLLCLCAAWCLRRRRDG